jgi:amidase
MHRETNDILALSATDLAAAIRERGVSCVEVMRATLAHIDRVNPAVNAIVNRREDAALLAEARERDADLARGDYRGVLHGFPQAVKDLEPMRDLVTTMGSPILKNFVAPADGIMAERMRKAGAIFIGRTNAPEFGLGSHTYNPVYGRTRNAYDATKSAGGSSGGAAVAVALHMLPVADGGDYGGSLRNPAGWNNIFSLRPSFGRVPAGERDVWTPTMSVLGPMARNVPDLCLLLGVQAGYDPRAPFSLDSTLALDDLDRDVKGARIAWCGDFNGALPFEPGVLDTCRAALKSFEEIGCTVEEAAPSFDIEALWRAFLAIRASQAGAGLLDFYKRPELRALLKPEAVYEIESGMKLTAFDVAAASQVRTQWYQAVTRFFERYDFFVAPTAQLFPFDVELDWPKEIAGRAMTTYHEWMKVVVPGSMCGCPIATVPAGFGANGLPMGLQLVGRPRADLACLQLAHAYDKATNWVTKHPPPRLGNA